MENLKSTNNEDKNKKNIELEWESWIVDLEEQEQPDACSIDDEDCEACGS
tara:strand:+ start:163 stop:312 length:150 start_codon:yes stop_codon:yes gene_type:complete